MLKGNALTILESVTAPHLANNKSNIATRSIEAVESTAFTAQRNIIHCNIVSTFYQGMASGQII